MTDGTCSYLACSEPIARNHLCANHRALVDGATGTLDAEPMEAGQ